MVFYPPSARAVDTEVARDILREVNWHPFVTPVGLFVNQTPTEIVKVASSLRLNVVQLHGDEGEGYLEDMPELSIIKAIKADPATLGDKLIEWDESVCAFHLSNLVAILLDSPGPEAGGTGIENNWNLIEEILRAEKTGMNIILAGGLTPENVGDVVRRIRPYAVDVSSGIEESKGKKSVEKMRRFVNAVREADASP